LMPKLFFLRQELERIFVILLWNSATPFSDVSACTGRGIAKRKKSVCRTEIIATWWKKSFINENSTLLKINLQLTNPGALATLCEGFIVNTIKR
jgi:hypothetical protein